MNRRSFAAWLVLASAIPAGLIATSATATAQDDAPHTISKAAQTRYEALLAEYRDGMSAWSTEMSAKAKAARNAGEEFGDDEFPSPLPGYLAKFKAASDEYAGTENAVPFLAWIVTSGAREDIELARACFTTLASTHAASPNLDDLVSVLPNVHGMFGDVNASLTALVDKSPSKKLREWATFARDSHVVAAEPHDSKAYDEALGRLITLNEATEDQRLKPRLESKLLIAESFAIGMVAPDIEGIDLDGTAFKLSDYAGKVVFVDFWGDW